MSSVNPTTQIEYRPIDGFPGYRVGSDGSVWSCWKLRPRGGNTGSVSYLSDEWRPRKLRLDKDGYQVVGLQRNRKAHYYRVHQLVLGAFVGPAPDGCLAAHENGEASDNIVTNLRWDTQAGNVADKRKHGTHQCGSKHGMAKLTESDVLEIRRLSDNRILLRRDIAIQFGISIPTVGDVVRRVTWKHLP